ncbi:MAG: DUF5677 domain-containing protein [Thermoanaerobaculia bacterium]
MPTDPLKMVLDRDLAMAEARETIEIAAPLLRELVNHGTNAYIRCQALTDRTGSVDEDLAAFTLYRQVLELTDGIEVLVSNSCPVAAIPLVRSSFEAVLGLEFILRAESGQRGLAWLCGYLVRKQKFYKSLDETTPQGAEYRKRFELEIGRAPGIPSAWVKHGLAGVAASIAMDHLKDLFAEVKSAINENQHWYSIRGGPKDLSGLADHLGHSIEYKTFYTRWSRFAYAGDLAAFLARDPAGEGAVATMRSSSSLQELAAGSVTIALRATKLMVHHYRDGERLEVWYEREIMEPMARLETLRQDFLARRMT